MFRRLAVSLLAIPFLTLGLGDVAVPAPAQSFTHLSVPRVAHDLMPSVIAPLSVAPSIPSLFSARIPEAARRDSPPVPPKVLVELAEAETGITQEEPVGPFAAAMPGFESITSDELISLVNAIAGPPIKTRWCGTKGNRSAGAFAAQRFIDSGLDHFGKALWQYFPNEKKQCRNIIAFVKGTDLADEYVIVGAHYDSVRAGPGADDNASGTAAVLEIAEAFGLLAQNGVRPRRTIVFVLFDAEEAGLKGSQYFVSYPPVEMRKLFAMVNLDMIGRNEENFVYYYGVPQYQEFSAQRPGIWRILDAANELVGMKLTMPPRSSKSFWRTDQWPFYDQGFRRVLLLNTGKHADYHTAGDTPEKLDYVKMRNIARLTFLAVWQLAGGK